MVTTIFKYLKFRDNLLQDNGLILRATPRNKLNDPFEFLPPDSLVYKIKEIHKNRNAPPPSYKKISENFFSFNGAISFAESKSNLLMWSHYADEHKGVVLGFDKKNSFFKDLKRVKYDSIIPDELISDIDINDNNFLLQLFYLKSDEWIYEKEHRIVRDLIDSEYRIDNETKRVVRNLNEASTDWMHFFVVPYEALLAVYFGCRMKDDEKRRICKMLANTARGTNFTPYEALQSKQSFRLEFHKFDTNNDSCIDTEQDSSPDRQ